MALQWMILMYVVAAEAAIAILLTLPSPKLVKNRLASLISLILQPAMFIVPFAGFQILGSLIGIVIEKFIVPFAGFQLLDIYWKFEHQWPMCTAESCTASERDRLEKAYYKTQRNVILCAAAIFIYCSIYRICQFYKEIQHLEEIEKRAKDM